MKVIIIYSGKGGVGKTTTTANIAKSLAAQKKKVFVLDADVNTPSMNTIFPDSTPNKNLMVESLGYTTKNMIYIEQSMVRQYIRDSIRKIQKFNPQFVLIDTPPSITDVHISLMEALKVSGVLMVSQPNELSLSDVNRTHAFFSNKGVPTIGIVENMADLTKEPLDYNWLLLGRVEFQPGFDYKKVYTKSKDVYGKIAENFKTLDKIILENIRKSYFDESISLDDVKSDHGYKDHLMAPKDEWPSFVNLATWDWIRDKLKDMSGMIGLVDALLDWCTVERIKRMLEAFAEEDQAYFMIAQAPCTEIHLFPGEIGQASLFLSDSHYGIPKVKYKTAKGDIVLFPHEVIPATREMIEDNLMTGGKLLSDGRYLPSKETLQVVFDAFGNRTGIRSNWEEEYRILVA